MYEQTGSFDIGSGGTTLELCGDASLDWLEDVESNDESFKN